MLPHDLQSLRKHLPALGLFITPVLLVKLAALTVGTDQPSAYLAHVQSVSVQTPLAPPPPRKANEAEVAAAARIAQLRALRFGPSPLYYFGGAAVYVPQLPVEDEPEPMVDDSLNVVIRAVMSTREAATGSTSSIAIINGRQRRVGDVIAQWRIVAINTAGRTVTFEHMETGEREARAVLGP